MNDSQQGPVSRFMSNKVAVAIVVVVLAAGGTFAGLFFFLHSNAHQKDVSTAQKVVTTETATVEVPASQTVDGLQVDLKKEYGNKYADGILPVGDSKYVATAAEKGKIYACSTYVSAIKNGNGGASTRGPWFTNNNTEYDINKKPSISGKVTWQSSFTNTVAGTIRTIVTNDLPMHTTGVFPVARTDPAIQYDANPNTITAQSLTFSLPTSPTYGDPQCMNGEVGIMLTGVVILNGFDAAGRDAGSWEVQDSCSGHPQGSGQYHYHTLSSCIQDTSIKTVIGYALDGFPITGPKLNDKNILTTDDLDECHGIYSNLVVNGKDTMSYHYVMTQDFPYSVSCFRATQTQVVDPDAPKGDGHTDHVH